MYHIIRSIQDFLLQPERSNGSWGEVCRLLHLEHADGAGLDLQGVLLRDALDADPAQRPAMGVLRRVYAVQ